MIDQPDGVSDRADACGCGAGAPCVECNSYDDQNPPRNPPDAETINGFLH